MVLVGEQKKPATAAAADLGKFGSREWNRSVLTDYKTHFAPLEHTQGAFDQRHRLRQIQRDALMLLRRRVNPPPWVPNREG